MLSWGTAASQRQDRAPKPQRLFDTVIALRGGKSCAGVRELGSGSSEVIGESLWGAFGVKTFTTRELLRAGQRAKVCGGAIVEAEPLRPTTDVAGLTGLRVTAE